MENQQQNKQAILTERLQAWRRRAWTPAALLTFAWLPAGVAAAGVAGVRAGGQIGVIGLEALGFVLLAAVTYCVSWGAHRVLGRRSPLWLLLGLFVGLVGLGSVRLVDDLGAASERLSGGLSPSLLLVAGIGAAALLVVALVAAGYWLGSRRLWVGALVLSILMLVANHTQLEGDYPAVHLFLVLAAWAVFAGGLIGRRVLGASRSSELRWHGLLVWTLLGCLALLTLRGAPSTAHSQWVQTGAAPARVAFAGLLSAHAAVEILGEADGAWYQPKTGGTQAPTPGLKLPKRPVVLLLVVDALRADVAHGEHPVELPNLRALRESALVFRQARAPSTLTKVSVTSNFMSKYFSQQYWEKSSRGFVLPDADPSPRFPELLRSAKIRTVNYRTIKWLRNGNGHVRGFKEDTFVDEKRPRSKYTSSGPTIDAIIKRLRRAADKPLFIHSHLTDPHAPYNLGVKRGTAFQRYLSEVAHVDKQLGRLFKFIEGSALASRTIVILSADHGEAFGEHGANTHGTTLYEEELRVPLFVRLPGTQPRSIESLVSTLDIAPTVLDLFGVPTPGQYMGVSLLKFLGKAPPAADRPIASEGRLKQALVTPERMKVIYDTRSGEVEMYDLSVDPGEKLNLADEKERLAKPLSQLKLFFEAHGLKRPGYRPPYVR